MTFRQNNIIGRFAAIPWGLVTLIAALALIGTAMLYSATITNPGEANLPAKHFGRFMMALPVMILLALIPLRLWMRAAAPAYIVTMIMLIGVEFFGTVRGGAQRWLDVGPTLVQPSEFMKVALILALARYYQLTLEGRSGGLLVHLGALALILAPAALIIKQPDLGTTLTLVAIGGITIYFAGLRWRVILPVLGLGAAAVPLAYHFLLEPYQKKRVETLWNPGADPLGAGYQSEQAKIAIGSGGWDGKGFTQGTQSQLDYIPEQHTDFIYTVIAEEFGFLGAVGLLALWATVIGWMLVIAARSPSIFGRYAAVSSAATIAFYVLFNVGMVAGLLPVVGIPMPLISHAGTAMLTVMVALGITLAVDLHRTQQISR
ncbi:MAG: rod shape-determining protein RodA [Pseudomonadota bacterium]